MKIDEFLSSDAFTIVNKKLAKNVGIGQAIFLQELISQRRRFNQDEFYFTQNDMEDELGISPNTQGRYGKELKEKGLINITKKGIPARNYYTINDDKIINLISNGQTSATKMVELDTPKGCDYYNNKINSNNKNNISSSSVSIETSSEGNTINSNLLNSNNVLGDNDYTAQFDIFWKIYPHARKGKKQDAKKYFMQQDINSVMENVKLYKWKIELGIEDAKYVPACERWIRDFVPVNNVVKEQDLYKIVCKHMQMDGKKERYTELKNDFGTEKMDELVRKYNSNNKPTLYFK